MITKGNSLRPAFLLGAAGQQTNGERGPYLKQDRLCLTSRTQNVTWDAGSFPTQVAASLLFPYLIKEYLADVGGEMAQGSKRFAEDLQEAVLHHKQCLLLCCL